MRYGLDKLLIINLLLYCVVVWHSSVIASALDLQLSGLGFISQQLHFHDYGQDVHTRAFVTKQYNLALAKQQCGFVAS